MNELILQRSHIGTIDERIDASKMSSLLKLPGLLRREKLPEQVREVSVPAIGTVRLEYVGEVKYKWRHPIFGKVFERVIAGERIPDSKRKAYRADYEPDGMNLQPMRNTVSGSMGFIDFHSNLERSVDMYIATLGVEPESRRKGIGTALVHEVERIGLERGNQLVWCHVEFSRKKEQPRPFFEKLGYRMDGDTFFEWKMAKNLKRE